MLDHVWRIVSEEPHADVLETGEFHVSVERLRGLLQVLDAADNGFFLLAAAGEGVVATLSVKASPRAKLRHVGELAINVRREWRRRGVGRKMLEIAIGQARAAPALRRLSLAVFEPNEPAIRLYESAGFEHEGRRRGHVHVEGRDVDLLLMGMAV